MIEELRRKTGRFVLARMKHGAGLPRKVANPETAERAVVLCAVRDQSDFEYAADFVRHLRSQIGIPDVDIAVYADVPEKKLEGRFRKKDYKGIFLTRDDTNWYRKPISNLKPLQDKEYDLLFDISVLYSLPVRFLTAEIKAGTKAGRASQPGDSDFYDFTLKMKSEPSVRYLAEQLEKYLLMMNRTS